MAIQRPAFAALAELGRQFAGLPAPYITVHSTGGIDLQLSAAEDFETWRAALQIPGSAVTLHDRGEWSWLAADGTFADFPIHLAGFGIALTREQIEQPRDLTAVAA